MRVSCLSVIRNLTRGACALTRMRNKARPDPRGKGFTESKSENEIKVGPDFSARPAGGSIVENSLELDLSDDWDLAKVEKNLYVLADRKKSW